jgi:Zn-dependent M28 family amino/carboxypeptidase
VSELSTRLSEDLDALAGAIGERSDVRPQALAAAAQHIERRWRAAGLEPWREEFAVAGKPYANLVAETVGTAGDWLVVGAHYDSVAGSPGADDNATGVAALIELSSRWARRPPPLRRIRWCAFANEEAMRWDPDAGGSWHHAQGTVRRGERIAGMLCLDSLGCYHDLPGSQSYPWSPLGLIAPRRGDFAAVIGPWRSRRLVRRAVAEFRAAGSLPAHGFALPGSAWVLAGDHGSFDRLGIPAIAITDTDRWRYQHFHRSSDHPGQIDLTRFAAAVEAIDAVIADLARAPELP